MFENHCILSNQHTSSVHPYLPQLCRAWSGDYARSTKDVIEGLTSNPALRTVLCYSWLDHGTPPKDSPFLASLRKILESL